MVPLITQIWRGGIVGSSPGSHPGGHWFESSSRYERCESASSKINFCEVMLRFWEFL